MKKVLIIGVLLAGFVSCKNNDATNDEVAVDTVAVTPPEAPPAKADKDGDGKVEVEVDVPKPPPPPKPGELPPPPPPPPKIKVK